MNQRDFPSLPLMSMSNTSEVSARAYIRRESLDIYNRLHSIEADIAFVNEVRRAYPTFPLIRTVLSFNLIFPSA